MKKYFGIFVFVIILIVIALSFRSFNTKFGPKLTAKLDNTKTQNFVVWIYLTDKGPNAQILLSNPQLLVTQKSLERRAKVKPQNELVDITDIPIYQPYADELVNKGIKLRHAIKWFNSISAEVTRNQLEEISDLNFVSQIELVETFEKRKDDIESISTNEPPQINYNNVLADTFSYGNSFTQINQIKVNLVHNQGIFGQGVLIASFDNGWRNQTHEVFTTLPMTVVSQYDFQLQRPGANNVGSTTTHGTQTLSNIGGYMPGKLISPAFKSSFLVARTEVDSFERPIEMDNWVAAAQWADSLGADVISSSLGYLEFDAGYQSWTWQDMNGRTLVVTNGADLAVNKGITVCNSAGNGGSSTHNTLGGPADGDSVISVGAVTSTGTRASFSSVGPTTDNPPRIKPDVMAMGSSNYVASTTSNTSYTYSSGTSFSCPLTAGVVGLILSANKSLTPMQVLGILRKFASNSSSPNNLMGWGIIDASLSVDSARKLDNTPPTIQHTQPFTNTTNTGTLTFKARIFDNGIIRLWTNQAPLLYYRKSTNGGTTWTAFTAVNLSSQNRDTFFFPIPGSSLGTIVQYYFAAQDIALPNPLVSTLPSGGSGINPPGTTPPSTRFQFTVGTVGISQNNEIPKEFKVYDNYPNPFNPSTQIKLDVPKKMNVNVTVFDITGKEVKVLLNSEINAGSYSVEFNAAQLSSGVYFYRVNTQFGIVTKKMLMVK